MTSRPGGKWLTRLGVLAFWLVVWQLASQVVGSQILLAGPWDTLEALFRDGVTIGFWQAIWFSFQRIVLGFLGAFCIGVLLAILTRRFALLRTLLEPAVSFIKSVPVVCIIVLLLILVASRQVSVIAVVLVVFPAVYFSAYQGLLGIDQGMGEMLGVFGVSPVRRMGMLSWPSMLPFLLATSKVVVGMGWKSGVAAEIIGIPLGSIGERLYLSKITLETAELFSWTLVIVLVSTLCERVFVAALARSGSWSRALAMPRSRASKGGRGDAARATTKEEVATRPGAHIVLDAISRSFDGREVIQDFSYVFHRGERYCLSGASGIGKTTLIRIIAGLDVPDAGSVRLSAAVGDGADGASDHARRRPPVETSMVFQEARLFEDEDAIDNIRLVVGTAIDPQGATALLSQLLPVSALRLPAAQLSGGMRRRVELCRALAMPSQTLILDEPFAGLDDASKARAIALIDTYLGGRTLIVVTHDIEDAAALGATVIDCEGDVGFCQAARHGADDAQR